MCIRDSHPAHARRGDVRVRASQHGLREGRPADRRTRQVPRLRLLPRRRAGDRRQGQGRGRARGPAGRRPRPAAMTTLFYIAAAVAVLATVLVITRTNLVHALLYLVVSLFAVAVVFYTLGAPFVAALEVIVYAGAIMMLFLFAVMLLDVRAEAPLRVPRRARPAASPRRGTAS